MKTREQVPLGLIEDNPWQPRQEMAPGDMRELAAALMTHHLRAAGKIEEVQS